MPEAAIAITKLLLYASLMGSLGEPEVGVGAYAVRPDTWYDVCINRVENGWNDLDCSWYCLVSAIEQDDIGQWWFVDVGSMHLCLTVDVGAGKDLEALRQRGEIVELPHWLAMKAGWDGYTPNVRIWRIG